MRFHLAGRQYHGDPGRSVLSFSLLSYRLHLPFFPSFSLFQLFLSFARVIIASARKTSISAFRKESLSLRVSFLSLVLLVLASRCSRALGLPETARNANPNPRTVFFSPLHNAHTRARAAFKSFLNGSRD